jgi:hypothetical protein
VAGQIRRCKPFNISLQFFFEGGRKGGSFQEAPETRSPFI